MPWTLPRLSRFLLAILSTAPLLATSACKPEHEIGKVQYDSLVTWSEMFKDGRQGVRKYIGKTVTINELVMLNTDSPRDTKRGRMRDEIHHFIQSTRATFQSQATI